MLRRQLAGVVAAILTVLTLPCAVSLGVAGAQEKAKDQPAAGEKAIQQENATPPPVLQDGAQREAAIGKMIAEYDLKPHPLPPIPDDPPPHEGAMISLPYIVEPPDLMIVEVLEALPGRPISGERLVRSDGMISLGFYGDVKAKGLTIDQVKVTILKHLRKFLTDHALGLEEPLFDTLPDRPAVERPQIPRSSKEGENPLDANKKVKPRSSSNRSRSDSSPFRSRSASFGVARQRIPVRAARMRGMLGEPQAQAVPAQAPNLVVLPPGPGRITITIDVGGPAVAQAQKEQLPAPQAVGNDGPWQMIPPAASPTVFVDITAYNSKHYYVLGDVGVTGRLPWTGNETVIDALQYAGGLLSTAEPKDIRLIRPGRDGKPAKVYKVDLAAIQEKADVMSNYQIFPGDSLIVGRNEDFKNTAEIDSLNAPILSITGMIVQEAFTLRALQFATGDNRDALLKELVDFWAKELSRPGGVEFDEQTLRDALIRKLKLTPAPLTTQPAPR